MLFKWLKEMTVNRAKIYSYFSKIYRGEVNQELLGIMKHSSKPIIDDHEMSIAYNELRNFLEEIEINNELVEDLAADYAASFLGIGRHSAHPYESVYLSEDRIVMREPWYEVLKAYHSKGLQKVEWFLEPEDHVAIQLEFMSCLCLKMKEALDKEDTEEVLKYFEAQNNYLNKHLIVWIPQFCDDIVKGSTKYDFYKIMGAITKRYILLEERTIAQLTKRLRHLLEGIQ